MGFWKSLTKGAIGAVAGMGSNRPAASEGQGGAFRTMGENLKKRRSQGATFGGFGKKKPLIYGPGN